MSFRLKVFLIVVSLFASVQASAYVLDYKSVFKPAKVNRSLPELQRNLAKDIFELRSLFNFKEKKLVGSIKPRVAGRPVRKPAEI